MTYPMLLDLRERRVVVIGGGTVAARKVAGLLEAGAQVTVISSSLHPKLVALGERIETRLMAYTPGLLTALHPLLVFAATDSHKVNQQVAAEAHALGILVNIADEGSTGDFATMATLRRGPITLGIASGGASPALAGHLRAKLDAQIGPEYEILARWLSELRPRIHVQVNSQERRSELWHALIDSEALDRLRSGDEAGARAIIEMLISDAIQESE